MPIKLRTTGKAPWKWEGFGASVWGDKPTQSDRDRLRVKHTNDAGLFEYDQYMHELLSNGISGWGGFVDGEGNEWPYTPDDRVKFAGVLADQARDVFTAIMDRLNAPEFIAADPTESNGGSKGRQPPQMDS